MDSLDDIDFTDFLPLIAIGVIEGSKPEKLRRNTGQKGGEYLQDLNSTPRRIADVLVGSLRIAPGCRSGDPPKFLG